MKAAFLLTVVLAGLHGWISSRAATPAPSPRSPDHERAAFQLADPHLSLELVAAEPEVTSPVALAWDASGRLFVAEMNDYPAAPEGGSIRLLEDLDGDGRHETSHRFAEGLHFPASVLPWRDGLLVAAAPDLIFLRDTDGDGRADERRVLLSGFHPGNQQLRVNSLTWGLDHWVYGANGRNDGELRGGALTEPLPLRRRDFRWDPDSGRVEALAGASQFGLGFTSAGDRFLSWNTIPLRHEVLPLRHLDRTPALANLDPLHDCLEPADDHRVFPIGPSPETFNRESITHFNALSGLHVFGGDALGPAYAGNAFMGETIRGLVHRRVLEPRGATFAAKRAPGEEAREFLASADPWTHFVNAATGPDGALYLCDFYRRWVEHPGFVPAAIRDTIDWREGAQHGRIWRVVRTDGAPPKAPVPMPATANDRELVTRLRHPNAWQRLTAQRLLIERARSDPARRDEIQRNLTSVLRQRTRENAAVAPSRLHALHSLETLGALDDRLLVTALNDRHPSLRAAALRLVDERTNSAHSAPLPVPPRIARAMARRATDEDATVRLRATLASRLLPSRERVSALESAWLHSAQDPWLTRSILVAAANEPAPFAARLLETVTTTNFPFLAQLGGLVAAHAVAHPTAGVIDRALGKASPRSAESRVALLAGIAEYQGRTDVDPARLTSAAPDVTRDTLQHARQFLADPSRPKALRSLALSLQILTSASTDLPAFREYLTPAQLVELQLVAADRLAARADLALARQLLESAPDYSSQARRRLLSRLATSKAAVPALPEAWQAGRVDAAELDPAAREAWLRLASPELRERAAPFLGVPADADRAAQVTRFQPALSGSGDRRRGAMLYAAQCIACHRIGAQGGQVGPDLSGIGSRAPEILLVDILDPSRSVAPDFLAYAASLADGEEVTGLLIAESARTVVLRRANVPDQVLARDRILSLRPTRRSLMPDGLEAALTTDGMRDLLAFLAAPDATLLPADATSP